jgi:formate hydrogenlyase subunit 6/NADH:ubiquinone oxidoreductase subunit I
MPMDVLDRILRPLRRGTVTSRYPAAPPELPAAARGLPELDVTRCDANAACAAACPTGAIRVSRGAWSLDLGACIFCAACARACPTAAIGLRDRIELATETRADLVVVRPIRDVS